MNQIILVLIAGLGLSQAVPLGPDPAMPALATSPMTDADVPAFVNFLSNRVTYAATALDNKKVPLSFHAPVEYFGNYVCSPVC